MDTKEVNVSDRRRVLAVIPARGGSKGLPGKNLLSANGKPLIAYSIEAALQSKSVDQLIVSTDDDEIMEVAQRYGATVPFRRPTNLATDTASTVDVIAHALDSLPGYEVVVVLQPTSPLRTPTDIDDALQSFEKSGAAACVSVSPVEQSPYWMYTVDEHNRLHPLIDEERQVSRRQDLPAVYTLNGAIYVIDVNVFFRYRTFIPAGTVSYLMPRERSLDIDTAEDFEIFLKNLSTP